MASTVKSCVLYHSVYLQKLCIGLQQAVTALKLRIILLAEAANSATKWRTLTLRKYFICGAAALSQSPVISGGSGVNQGVRR